MLEILWIMRSSSGLLYLAVSHRCEYRTTYLLTVFILKLKHGCIFNYSLVLSSSAKEKRLVSQKFFESENFIHGQSLRLNFTALRNYTVV